VENSSEILALNLLHNNLTGSISTTFLILKQINSLDFFYNNLNGVNLMRIICCTQQFRSFKCGTYNNLSGKTLERKYQFETFDENSYEGNPLVCGTPLHNNECLIMNEKMMVS
jgi:hypothetical protein